LLSRLVHLSTVLVAFLTLQLPALGQFETRSNSTISQSPVSVAVADFNHDGKLDLAVAASYYGQVAILLGNGDGTFQSAVYYNIDNQTLSLSSITVADFNRDGNTDIAVADQFGSNISVLLGNGDGTFQSPSRWPLNGEPIFVVTGDFNNDQIPDIATVEEFGCNCISILLGNGDGTFESPKDTTPTVPPLSISVGDLNHDGLLDVASVGGATGELTVLLGNGDGTFSIGLTYSAGTNPNSAAIADFNNDRKLDVAVADGIGGALTVFLGNGDGTFQPGVSYPANFPASIHAADFNGDGNKDLVVGNGTTNPGMITVLLGRGMELSDLPRVTWLANR